MNFTSFIVAVLNTHGHQLYEGPFSTAEMAAEYADLHCNAGWSILPVRSTGIPSHMLYGYKEEINNNREIN